MIFVITSGISRWRSPPWRAITYWLHSGPSPDRPDRCQNCSV